MRGMSLWTHLGKAASRELLLVERRGLDEAGVALLTEAIAVAADGDDLAVVEQAVEDRDPFPPTLRAALVRAGPCERP
jgi:hypothetical protein